MCHKEKLRDYHAVLEKNADFIIRLGSRNPQFLLAPKCVLHTALKSENYRWIDGLFTKHPWYAWHCARLCRQRDREAWEAVRTKKTCFYTVALKTVSPCWCFPSVSTYFCAGWRLTLSNTDTEISYVSRGTGR